MRDVAEGFVACPAWEWLPGALALPIASSVGAVLPARRYLGAGLWLCEGERTPLEHDGHGLLPDLADPATMGCVEALMQRQWADVEAERGPMTPRESFAGERWVVTPIRRKRSDPEFFFDGPTKAAAILATFVAGAERMAGDV